MLAEQHIVMYEELVSKDIMGVTYVLDLTNLDALRARDQAAKLAKMNE